MTLKSLHWVRRTAGLWETQIIAEYWLGILGTPDGYKFRGEIYPSLRVAQQAGQVFVQSALSPLLADTPEPHLQKAA